MAHASDTAAEARHSISPIFVGIRDLIASMAKENQS